MGEAVGERPRHAEAVGDGRAGEGGELAHRVHAETLQGLHERLGVGAVREQVDAERREVAAGGRGAAAAGPSAGRRARARSAAASAHSRVGPPPRRTGRPIARRVARQDALLAAVQAAQAAARRSRPAPAGRARAAAPMPSSERTIASQVSATASGLGGTRTRSGHRARPSPRGMPARTPWASAAPETSPRRSSRPGAGASASARPLSASGPAGRDDELEAGEVDAHDHTNVCSHDRRREGKRDLRLRTLRR